jgi:glutaminyl-peptide cyclotransferase
MKKLAPVSVVLLLLASACNNADTDSSVTDNGPAPVPVTTPAIVQTLPHDTSYFTQGLEFYNGTLLEGTGLEGKSKLVQKEFPGGKVLKQVELDPSYFGEGITVFRDTLYQLTWQNRKVLVYDARTFTKLKELPINTEGWGITNNGKELIVSDGSSNLYFYEPGTFRLLRTQMVTENGSPAVNLNELEYINGYVYANQWQYNYILKIDPASGQVVSKMDFTDLVKKVHAEKPDENYFNGIAYNPATKKLYVTGKNWPHLYEVAVSLEGTSALPALPKDGTQNLPAQTTDSSISKTGKKG